MQFGKSVCPGQLNTINKKIPPPFQVNSSFRLTENIVYALIKFNLCVPYDSPKIRSINTTELKSLCSFSCDVNHGQRILQKFL